MGTLSKKLVVIGAMGVVVVLSSLLVSSGTAAAPGPAQGIAVRIVGGSVSLTGTPTVDVTNTESTPLFIRDLDNPARMPFRHQAELEIEAGISGVFFSPAPLDIPDGYRAMIDYVGVFGEMPVGQILTSVSVSPKLDGTAKRDFIGTTFGGTGPSVASGTVDIYFANTEYHAAVEPGDNNLYVGAMRSSGAGNAKIYFTLDGHFVKVSDL